MFRVSFNIAIIGSVSLVILAVVSPMGCSNSTRQQDSLPSATDASEYVGSQRCAECHSSHADQYAQTGHASTFFRTQDLDQIRQLDQQTFRDPDRDLVYQYHYDPANGLAVTIPALFGDEQFPLTYAVGSNQHAMTFLTLIPNRSGGTAGIEHRVTMFGPSKRLGLTPGHHGESIHEEVQLFGKVIESDTLAACIGCHTTTARIAGTQITDLRSNVGCESCHGAGSEHIAAVDQGLADLKIASLRINGGLSARSQVEVCGKCHRLPSDLDPDDLRTDNPKLARFQSVGLLQSRCFTESSGALSCSTCHDPHRRPADQQQVYVSSCLRCHSPTATSQKSCPVSPERGCIACHMPPVEVHPGISFHDHWIRIRDEPSAESTSSP